LAGVRVLVTRASKQAGVLSAQLREQGALPIELPVIDIAPAPTEPLDDAIRRLADYDWVVFTSVNGVTAFAARLSALQRTMTALNGVQIGAIGRITAQALTDAGLHVDFVPGAFVAEAAVEGL